METSKQLTGIRNHPCPLCVVPSSYIDLTGVATTYYGRATDRREQPNSKLLNRLTNDQDCQRYQISLAMCRNHSFFNSTYFCITQKHFTYQNETAKAGTFGSSDLHFRTRKVPILPDCSSTDSACVLDMLAKYHLKTKTKVASITATSTFL